MTLYLKLIIFNIFVAFVTCALPTLFPVCFRNDPEISKCVLRSIEVLRPRFPSGDLGEGFQISRIEPFYVARFQHGYPQLIQITVTDMYIHGLSKFNVVSLNVNVKNEVNIDMVLTFPKLDMRGNYRLRLGVFGIPRYSEGIVTATYTNVKIRANLKGRIYRRNGVEYIRFDPIYFKFINYNIQNVNLSNLFEGSIVLGQLVYNYILYDRQYISNIINPDFEKTFSEIFTKLANQIADQGSFNELFPK